MSAKGSKIKNLIREYLLEEGILRENLPDPKSQLDFGFTFAFPPGQEKLRMSVLKPKKKDLILLILQTQLSKQNISALKSQGNKREMQFFINLRKFFLFKEVFFKIDIQQYRYEISDQFFLAKNGFLSKNSFFEKIQRIYFCYNYSGIITREFCLGETKIDKESSSGFDFTLYS